MVFLIDYDRNPLCGPVLALILIGSSLVIIAPDQSLAQELLKLLPPPEKNGTTTTVAAIEAETVETAETTEIHSDPEDSVNRAGVVGVRHPMLNGANREGEPRVAQRIKEVAETTTIEPPHFW